MLCREDNPKGDIYIFRERSFLDYLLRHGSWLRSTGDLTNKLIAYT